MTAIASAQSDEFAPLRPDLELIKGAPEAGGAPTWLLHDAFASKYVRIGWLEYEIMHRWHLGSADAIVAAVSDETTLDISHQDVGFFAEFLQQSGLTRTTVRGGAKHDPGPGFWKQFGSWKFPLIAPNTILDATIGLPRAIMSVGGAMAALIILLFVTLQLAQDWSWFRSDVISLFDPSNAAGFLGVLIGVKVVHEFGHAWACRHYGLDVPAMGVSVFFLWPFLYTDTTAVWRLTSRRQRALVGAAGVLSELILGLLALFVWCLLDDGVVRDATLFVATVSVALSLMVNANPFMKWDGYYVMSDLLGMENMQARALALGKVVSRNAIFGLKEPLPESYPPGRMRFLVAYAAGSWCYRIVLFLGLALMLYSFFFKVAGIALMIYTLARYIVMPLLKDFTELSQMRDSFSWQRSNRMLAGCAGFMLLLLVLPVDRNVETVAIMRPAAEAELYAPAPGQVVARHIEHGELVTQGAPLVTLTSLALSNEAFSEQVELSRVERLARRVDSVKALDNRKSVQRQLERQRAAIAEVAGRERDLNLKAPFAGRVVWQAKDLRPGRFVAQNQRLIKVVSAQAFELVAHVNDAAHRRLEEGATATFVPEDPFESRVKVKLVNIGASPVSTVDHVALLAAHGGAVPASSSSDLAPDGAWYSLRLAPTQKIENPPGRVLRGSLKISAKGQWLLSPLVRRVRQLVLTEAVF